MRKESIALNEANATLDELRAVLGLLPGEHIAAAARRVVRERDELRSQSAPPADAPMSDPRAMTMFCVLRSRAMPMKVYSAAAGGSVEHEPHRFQPGDLVCVEVPPNCTVHSADAQRLALIVSTSEQLADVWRESEHDAHWTVAVGALTESLAQAVELRRPMRIESES